MTYGTEMACGPNGLSTVRLVTDRRTLEQDAFNLLRTPQGTLTGTRTASNAGMDIAQAIGQHGRKALVMLPSLISATLKRDERIGSAVASVTGWAMPGGLLAMHIRVAISPADGTRGFTLVLEASAALLKLIGVE